MKHVLTKTLLLVAAAVSFSSCSKDGGGGGGNGGQQAAVPAIPGTPTGNVYAQNDSNTYCSFANNTVICHSRILQLNNTFSACNSNQLAYTDLNSMCSQLSQLQSLGNQCNVSMAAMQVYNTYCLNQNGGGTINPNMSNDPNMKTVQCEFEASRVSQGRRFGIPYTSETRTPKLSATLQFDGRLASSFDLQRRFLFFNIGSFGRTTMNYRPAGIKGTADTITLSNEGLDGSLQLSQSGFAGQSVKMDVMNDEGTMKLSVSCAGQGSAFKKNVAVKAFTQYVCRGKASLYGSHLETIEASFPYNASLLNSELNLAENLTATVTGDTGSDNARITFTASGVGSGVSLQTSAYLKTTTQLNGTDGLTTLNLTCGPQ